MSKLVWNAIVRNEGARIDRCINSLLPWIDGAVVVDTGSTDDTRDKIRQAFQRANKPVELYEAPFENFSQARNEALRRARESQLPWDYLLLADADMELRVRQPNWLNGHQGLSYDMQQVAGGISYFNRRLVNRKADGWYMGVTHEYLDIPTSGALDGADFVDHADGANRPDKFQRDIALLEEALKTEDRPGLIQRYHFYLAQSYFDSGDWAKAAEFYKKRVELGGWDEEVWNAQLHYAHCLGNMGDHTGFVWEMLRAYHMRPSRSESLYDLAKFFRERGESYTSLLFSEAGLAAPKTKDQLFVNDFVYEKGLREEYSICAYYDQRRRYQGGREANRLAMEGSEQARSNLFWYLEPLSADVKSFKAERIDFTPPGGYVALNPSVSDNGLLVRTVNYAITAEGRYRIRASDGSIAADHPIHTRNFIRVDDEWQEIALPTNWPDSPQFDLVRGFEDSRLFEMQGKFWTLSTVRELTHEGWCEQVLAPLERGSPRYGDTWRRILPKDRGHQKNWMPWVDGKKLSFVYRLGTLVDSYGHVVFEEKPRWDVGHISGGSQAVKIDRHNRLAIVHEARTIPGKTTRYYQHRFVMFKWYGAVERISPPFFFHDRQIEFAAGMKYDPDTNDLTISYGVRDCEAWLATMNLDEVTRFIYRDTLIIGDAP